MIEHRGLSYIEVLRALGALADTYLEIGTQRGVSLAAVGCDSIAIDPHFMIDRPVWHERRQCALFQMTSDEFFKKYDPTALFGHRKIDLAFIDGMHHAENVFRDFNHVESYCASNSIIAIHDAIPTDEAMTAREDTGGVWTGDVWKAVAHLRASRRDLLFSFVDAPPTGLVLCSRLDPLRWRFTKSREMPEITETLEDYLASIHTVGAEIAMAEILS